MSEEGTTFRLEPDDDKSIDEVAAAKVMDNLPDYEAQMRTLMTQRFRLVPELSTLVVGGPYS